VLDATRDAVAIRQRAAVDVGVLLSGGVDSSLLVGLLREVGVDDLSTFSIGFEDAGGERGDEFQYSDLIARHYGTRHHQLRIDEKEIIEQLPAAFRAMSEPMVSHDCIAFYLLSREVAKHCKGCKAARAPTNCSPAITGTRRWTARGPVSRPIARRSSTAATTNTRHRAGEMADRTTTPPATSSATFRPPGAPDAVDKALRLDSTVMLVDDPVKRVDNMTMAWGLEARTPFLDYRLVELSARIPARFKLPDGGKQVLKQAARRVIPSEVIDRKKGYFPVPGLKHLQGAP
jgi:asparagine synthase (glutamine-hydrolysing)